LPGFFPLYRGGFCEVKSSSFMAAVDKIRDCL
jgi:hypothetical protein